MVLSVYNSSQIENFQDFEDHVANLFRKDHWKVEKAKVNQRGYDLIVRRNHDLGAVQVKWLKNKVQTPQLQKFADFLGETEEGKQFNCGFFITTQGFGNPALALIKSWGKDVKINCGIAKGDTLEWIDILPPPPPPPSEKIYFGVFTCKGGVGKTTVAAHLAGALVLQNFDIALVDLDPEENLRKLVGDGIYLENPGRLGNTIQVFKGKDWDENAAQDCQIVICDCSPALERNPEEIIKKLDYCIIPTTLNPLGLNKHGNVIKHTVEKIREINQNAHLYILVNNFKSTSKTRMQLLRNTFLGTYQDISQTDDKFHCIDPEEVCIRASDQLYYWGIHLLENPDNPCSELAFNLVGGRCHPREDFIRLAEYISTTAGLGVLRS